MVPDLTRRHFPALLVVLLGLGILAWTGSSVAGLGNQTSQEGDYEVTVKERLPDRVYGFENLSSAAQNLTVAVHRSGEVTVEQVPSEFTGHRAESYYIRFDNDETTDYFVKLNGTYHRLFVTRTNGSATVSAGEHTVMYDYATLSAREQRILDRAIDSENGRIDGANPGTLEHLQSGGDTAHLGSGYYYVQKDGVYYFVATAYDPGTFYGLALAFQLFMIGCGLAFVAVGVRALGRGTVAAPVALLAGLGTVLLQPLSATLGVHVVSFPLAVALGVAVATSFYAILASRLRQTPSRER